MKITFTNPVTNEKHELTVATSIPCASLRMSIENVVDSFAPEFQAEFGKALVNAVNRAMKNNAVFDVVFSENIFAALAKRVTYGAYSIKTGDNGTGYALGSSETVEKMVDVFDKKEGKSKKTARVAFVTYADCVKFVKDLNRENKKNNVSAFIMSGDFNADEMRKIRYFIRCANGRLTDDDRANLAERGNEYAPFLMDKNDKDGKKARVQIFYDVFNKHTGKAVKAIQHIEDNVVKECTSYSSMYKLDKDSNETQYISSLFNEWLNSEMVTATSYRAKAPEYVKKSKKKEETKKEGENA